MLFLIISSVSTGLASERHTLLLYALGCDLEQDSGAVTTDLMEIRQVTKDSPVRVIAYLGGSQRWWLAGLEDNHCYDIEISNGEIRIINDWGTQESTSSVQLARFLKTYASEGNGLVFWGHGLPGFDGIGLDALYQDDCLTLSEIYTALENTGIYYRVLGFDACEMAKLEAAWLFSRNADYFIASPGIEATSGWNYKAVLSVLEHDSDEMIDSLQSDGLQYAMRDRSGAFLTVVDERQFRTCGEYLNRVLDSCQVAPGELSLSRIIAACTDQEAGRMIADVLRGQELTISDQVFDNAPDLPGIQDSYVSFINRR